MQAAKGQGDPPPELVKRWKCRSWGLAPQAGGMDDQTYSDIARMDELESVYGAVSRWRIGKLTPADHKIIAWLTEMKLMAKHG